MMKSKKKRDDKIIIKNVKYGEKDIFDILALEFVIWANENTNINILLKD